MTSGQLARISHLGNGHGAVVQPRRQIVLRPRQYARGKPARAANPARIDSAIVFDQVRADRVPELIDKQPAGAVRPRKDRQ